MPKNVVKVGEVIAGEVVLKTFPVPFQTKREEVATDEASAVEPVIFPKTLLAETWARLAKGKSPVTSEVKVISPLVISCPESVR